MKRFMQQDEMEQNIIIDLTHIILISFIVSHIK
jgi:hypothetical protein